MIESTEIDIHKQGQYNCTKIVFSTNSAKLTMISTCKKKKRERETLVTNIIPSYKLTQRDH